MALRTTSTGQWTWQQTNVMNFFQPKSTEEEISVCRVSHIAIRSKGLQFLGNLHLQGFCWPAQTQLGSMHKKIIWDTCPGAVCPSVSQCVLSVSQCVAVCLKCVAVQKRNLAGFNGQKQSCFSPLALTCVSRLIKLLQYFIWQMHMIVFLLLMVMIIIVMMIMIQDGPPV